MSRIVAGPLAVSAGSKRIVLITDGVVRPRIHVRQLNRFAERKIAAAKVAVGFVDERIDHEIQIARLLILERADIDPAAKHAAVRSAALIELRHAIHARDRIEIARVDCRAAGQAARA